MHTQLERHIKDLMGQHPALGAVLEEAGIGCTTCSLGTCRVKDILEIHDLDTARTRVLLQRMGEVIYGDHPFDVPSLERKASEPRSAFCPPLARMVEEHTYIKRLLALLPALIGDLGRDWDGAAPWVARSLDFIRQYADRYHHAKEEDLLFAHFDPESDIIRAMRGDHAEGRDHVRGATQALGSGDLGAVAHHLRAYGELLKGHIHREDTILYPWMDRTLTTRQVGELYGECLAVERRFGAMPKEQEAFVAELEARYRLG